VGNNFFFQTLFSLPVLALSLLGLVSWLIPPAVASYYIYQVAVEEKGWVQVLVVSISIGALIAAHVSGFQRHQKTMAGNWMEIKPKLLLSGAQRALEDLVIFFCFLWICVTLTRLRHTWSLKNWNVTELMQQALYGTVEVILGILLLPAIFTVWRTKLIWEIFSASPVSARPSAMANALLLWLGDLPYAICALLVSLVAPWRIS
jgi:hypothetical protein